MPKIHCQNCWSPLPDVEHSVEGFITCGICSTENRIPDISSSAEPPKLFTRHFTERLWELSWPWAGRPRLLGSLIVFISLVGLAICVFGHVYAFTDKEPEMLIIVGFATPIFVALAIFGATIFLNRTRLRVSSDVLIIEHQPVTWGGALEVPLDVIEKLFLVVDTFRGHKLFAVILVQTDGTMRKVGHGFATLEQAAYLERVLEERLQLPSVPATQGELAPLKGKLIHIAVPKRGFTIFRRLTLTYWFTLALLGGALLYFTG